MKFTVNTSTTLKAYEVKEALERYFGVPFTVTHADTGTRNSSAPDPRQVTRRLRDRSR